MMLYARLIAAGVAVLLLGFVVTKIYNAGYASADAKWTAIVEQERRDQTDAVRKAGEDAWRVIDRLNTEKEKLNEKIATLDAEGDADPDADTGGITAGSVQRINGGRAP